jgi:hypothetical protein
MSGGKILPIIEAERLAQSEAFRVLFHQQTALLFNAFEERFGALEDKIKQLQQRFDAKLEEGVTPKPSA